MATESKSELHIIPDLPPINGTYWAILLSACTMGETGADLLSHDLKLGYIKASLILGAIFLAAMFLELGGRGPKRVRYWFAIVATATVGTTLADFMSRTLALGYLKATLILLAAFGLLFATWRVKQVPGQKSLGSQLHYWAAILIASVLGTTMGDFVSNGSKLGFGGGAAVLGSCLALVFVIQHLTRVSRELCYWVAIILTSTFGASAGDYLTKDEGLAYSTWAATAALALLLAIVVAAVGAIERRKFAGSMA